MSKRQPSAQASLVQRRRGATLQTFEVASVADAVEAIARPGVRFAVYYLPPVKRGHRFALFLRISRDVRDDAHGVSNQLTALLPHVARLGGEVAAIYVENSVSAWDTRRTRHAFERLLSDAREGQLDAIAAWNQDRLGRRPEQIARLCRLVEDNSHIAFAMVSGTVDLRLASGKLQAQIAADVAEYESNVKSERVRLDVAAKRDRGEYLGEPPYGYEAISALDGRRVLALVEGRATVVAKMLELCADGLNASQVARWLNRENVPTAKGGAEWRPNHVIRILRNPAYAGLVKIAGELVEASWPGIVRRELWEEAGIVLDRESLGRKARSRNESYLLSGLVTGPEGAPGKADRLYYRGTSRRAYRTPGGTVDAAELEEVIPGVLARFVDQYAAELVEIFGTGVEVEPEVDPNAAELAEIVELENDLDDMLDARQISRDHYRRRAAKLMARRAAVAGSIRTAAKAKAQNRRFVLARATDFLTPGAIEAGWESMSDDTRRDVIESLIERIEVVGGRWVAGRGTTIADRVRIVYRWQLGE